MTAAAAAAPGLAPAPPPRREIPRQDDDYAAAAARRRLAFLTETTGAAPEHLGRYSFDPACSTATSRTSSASPRCRSGSRGRCWWTASTPSGTFYVPLATTEGALVASYNRGMKLLYAAGGVRTTVVAEAMQRAPAFGFDSAREARAFGDWLTVSFEDIKAEAEASTHVGRLHDIEQFPASRYMFLRFDYTTGDAAGQNLTGQATLRACAWIRAHYPGIREFYLEANLATDKKSSQVNVLRTRGKRVVAEATIPAALVRQVMHTSPGQMFRARQVSNLGGLLAGATGNANHPANAVAALFAATGQDIANVAESSAALVHTELLADGSYYYSITIPALIVATYGGGTGLPTQRECLELLGCYGPGRVHKFAEIVAATVLCGEVSLGAAVVAGEWVTAHERLGRNRP